MKIQTLIPVALICASCGGGGGNVGQFGQSIDIGTTIEPGSASYSAETGEYRITGGGENMWGTSDAFRFTFNKSGGDLMMTTDIAFEGVGGNAHRKAGLVVRESLDPEAPYADAIVHGDGLTSLQYRLVKGGETLEIQSPISAPTTVRLERTGDLITMSVESGGVFHPVGSVIVDMPDSIYAGLAVCSHDSTAMETAMFNNVEVENLGLFDEENRVIESTLETVDIETGVRTIVYRAVAHFEAPNWSRDGNSLIFNQGGLLYSIPATGGEPTLINTGEAIRCNNDHGLSPDGSLLAISDQTKGQSQIYVLPSGGGTPRLVTEQAPSYWHGWSPDGARLAYCASRDGEYDIYTIPVTGGRERRLTTATGLDDGPDYAPNGDIYFNSERTGLMKIWKMKPDGSGQEQMTSGETYGDWFPHPSPDSEQLLFLSYGADVSGHPANKEVALRIMPLSGGNPRVLVRLFGGQGTINVPSWSPDSRQAAFVSYRLVGGAEE